MVVYIQIFFGGFDSESFESFFGGILAHNVKGYIILRIFFLSILLNRLNNYFLLYKRSHKNSNDNNSTQTMEYKAFNITTTTINNNLFCCWSLWPLPLRLSLFNILFQVLNQKYLSLSSKQWKFSCDLILIQYYLKINDKMAGVRSCEWIRAFVVFLYVTR